MRPFKYNIGDTINGFLFYSEPNVTTPRKGIFICKYCLKPFETRVHGIASTHAKSCGCKSDEFGAQKRTIHGHNGKNGKTGEYLSWTCMLDRCYNEKHVAYPHYKKNGITVCDRWKYSFENFLSDMGMKPTKEHTIDRFPNQQGSYEPGNCRWATKVEQADNRVNVKLFDYNGKCQSLARWSEDLGISYNILKNRIKRGDPPIEAMRFPYISKKQRKAA